MSTIYENIADDITLENDYYMLVFAVDNYDELFPQQVDQKKKLRIFENVFKMLPYFLHNSLVGLEILH